MATERGVGEPRVTPAQELTITPTQGQQTDPESSDQEPKGLRTKTRLQHRSNTCPEDSAKARTYPWCQHPPEGPTWSRRCLQG